MNKEKYIKITFGNTYITTVKSAKELFDEIEDPDDIYEVQAVYMTKDEFNNLPEFKGF